MKMLSKIDDALHLFGTISTVLRIGLPLLFQTCNDVAGRVVVIEL